VIAGQQTSHQGACANHLYEALCGAGDRIAQLLLRLAASLQLSCAYLV